jgi:hypothetical protein
MAETINITVKQLNGNQYKVRVKTDDSTGQLIANTAAASGIDAKSIRLIHAGKDITENQAKTVDDLGVVEGSTLFVVVRLEGGNSLPHSDAA